MQHVKVFFQIAMIVAFAALILGVFLTWFSFIVVAGLSFMLICSLCFTCKEIWKDTKRKFKAK